MEKCDGYHVLRDDLIAGGAKRRGLESLLNNTAENDFIYAGTVMGHGALALAEACRGRGRNAHLFMASNQSSHPMLERLRNAGAILHAAEPAPIDALYNAATFWQQEHGGHLFPTGFDCGAFRAAMRGALRSFNAESYPEIWCSSVSGTLAGIVKSAFPASRVKIVSAAKGGNADYHAPEKYHRPAKNLPPYPSCPYTDAKVWQFAREHARPCALIWNAAG